MSRFSLRTRLTILVTVAAVVTLAGLTTGFNLLLRSNLNADANRVLQARSSAALEEVSVENAKIKIKEAPDQAAPNSQLWIYSSNRALERPPAAGSTQQLADSLAGGPSTRAEDSGADMRLYAVPVLHGTTQVGTVVAGLSLEPYEHSASRALTASLIYALAALALVVIATRLVVTRALRPVAEMTAEAADWSERDLDHRFNVGEPSDELTGLAATFDSMLDRLASALRHEQLMTAELSHELRTPLAAIVAEVELALRRDRGSVEYQEALRGIAARASQMQRTLETLLAASRGESLHTQATADAQEAGAQALAACEGVARDRGIELRLGSPPAPVRIDIDADTTERILAPLIENGCRYGRHLVELSVQPNGEAVEFVVADDGPGIADADRDRVFEPGFSGDQGPDSEHDGAGLGLALARRLARAVGGDVEALASYSGAKLRARVPMAR